MVAVMQANANACDDADANDGGSRVIAGAGTSAAAWQADAALAAVPVAHLDQLVPPGWRAVLVAPHPDDEVLACGALLQQLCARSRDCLLVAVTDGEGSHPDSALWPPERLRQVRPSETTAALQALGAAAVQVLRLGVADGAVSAAEAQLQARLTALLGPLDVVITTWRHDGHPDHEACARASAAAAAASGARLLEVPVWGWHWSTPADQAMPFGRAMKLPLTPAQLQRKQAAMVCFASQLESDPASSAGPVLPTTALDRLLTPFEWYFA